MMKGLDRSIELVACGSSGRFMDTYLEWDREVLEYCWDGIDYISAHRYSQNNRGDSAWYLAEGIEIDRVIEDYAALLGYVRGRKRSRKQVFLSFDEWNVWYRETSGDGGWKHAPHLLEEVYNLEDALVCAQYLNSFVRHADVVKVACIAQIVNVIAPLLTRGDDLLVQSIYYPFAAFSKYARGNSLRAAIDGPAVKSGERGEVPALDLSACHDAERGTAALFFVNRSTSEALTTQVRVAGARCIKVLAAEALAGSDAKLANTWEAPTALGPAAGTAQVDPQGGLEVLVPRLGFVAVQVALEKL
jgi:alpha-N-arabinofuranosidase